MSAEKLTRLSLWLSVVSLGIGLGAKIYDLVVLAGAWGAAPPASLALLPYGPHWPRDPGDFFQPLSVPILIGLLGAVIGGWKTPWQYRVWLWLPILMFVILWMVTPTVFWPMINELYGIASGKLSRSDTAVIQLVRRWVISDWARVAGLAVAFVSSVRAISMPFPSQR